MAVNRVIFSKDKGRMLQEKLKAALVVKFTAAKIKDVQVRGDNTIIIKADLTVAQWTGVKTKLEAKGYFADIDFDFN